MFTKQTLLATLLGGLTLYFLGWIFYDLVAGGYFEENALHHIPERMDMISIALGALIEAFVLANVYRHWSVSKPGHFCGFEFGAWIGLFDRTWRKASFLWNCGSTYPKHPSCGRRLEHCLLWIYWADDSMGL